MLVYVDFGNGLKVVLDYVGLIMSLHVHVSLSLTLIALIICLFSSSIFI